MFKGSRPRSGSKTKMILNRRSGPFILLSFFLLVLFRSYPSFWFRFNHAHDIAVYRAYVDMVGRARFVTFIKRRQIFSELFWVCPFIFHPLVRHVYICIHLMRRIISSFPCPHRKCYSITFVSEFNQARRENTRPFSLCLPSAVVSRRPMLRMTALSLLP